MIGTEPEYRVLIEDKAYKLTSSPFSGELVYDGDNPVPIENLRLLAPCVPSKIVAVGLNYKDHIQEMQHDFPANPVIFLKPATAVIGPEQTIVRPAMAQRVDYEAELAIIIGRRCKDVPAEKAAEFILGYTCMNDVTARDIQKSDGQWTRAKGFDTFAPLGPWIETQLDISDTAITGRLNAKTVQASNTKYMNWNPYELVAFVSSVMTLEAGDVISTGTPSGIGPMQQGDLVEVEVQGIGVLRNHVR